MNKYHQLHTTLWISLSLTAASSMVCANNLDDFVSKTLTPTPVSAAPLPIIPPVKVPFDIKGTDALEHLINTQEKKHTAVHAPTLPATAVALTQQPSNHKNTSEVPEALSPSLTLSEDLVGFLPKQEAKIEPVKLDAPSIEGIKEKEPKTKRVASHATKASNHRALSTPLSSPLSAPLAPNPSGLAVTPSSPISSPRAQASNTKYTITQPMMSDAEEPHHEDAIERLIAQDNAQSDPLEKIAREGNAESVLQFITTHLQPLDDKPNLDKDSLALAPTPQTGPETGRIRPPAIEINEFKAQSEQQPSASMWKTVQEVAVGALGLLGVKYRFGGNTPETGLDCSGFVRYVYSRAMGINLPRTSHEISQVGRPIDSKNLVPGDLVFFNTRKFNFSHVGIYLGDNRFIHSPRTGKDVEIVRLTDRYWSSRFNGGRRILGTVKSSARMPNK